MLDKRFPGPDNVIRHSFDNGITVLVHENFSSPTIVVDGALRVGAIQECNQKVGLSSFTSDMLMRGTRHHDFSQIFEKLESVGANLGFGSGRHVTQFSGQCLVEDIDLLLELMAGSLRFPTFPSAQVERVRGHILTDFQMRANDTRRTAVLAFMETLYDNHPYGRSIRGYPHTIPTITAEDLVDFRTKHYGPQGMIIAVVGAIETETVLAKIAAVFGDWENKMQKPMFEVNDIPRPTQEVVIKRVIPGKTQTDLVLGLPGPRRSAQDYLAASLMNTVLGVFGMMGRIGQTVREELGLAYYASSHLAGGLGPAPWTADAGTAPESVSRVITGIKNEIDRIQNEPIPASELEDCISYRVGSLPVGLETNSAQASTLVDMEIYDLGLDYLQRFPELMRSVSADQVMKAAQKYLSKDQLVIAVAGS